MNKIKTHINSLPSVGKLYFLLVVIGFLISVFAAIEAYRPYRLSFDFKLQCLLSTSLLFVFLKMTSLRFMFLAHKMRIPIIIAGLVYAYFLFAPNWEYLRQSYRFSIFFVFLFVFISYYSLTYKKGFFITIGKNNCAEVHLNFIKKKYSGSKSFKRNFIDEIPNIQKAGFTTILLESHLMLKHERRFASTWKKSYISLINKAHPNLVSSYAWKDNIPTSSKRKFKVRLMAKEKVESEALDYSARFTIKLNGNITNA